MVDLPSASRSDTRHRSLRDTLRWSLTRLDAEQRRGLASLAAFSGPFDLGACSAVVGVDGARAQLLLGDLVGEALVQLDRRGPATRVSLLSIVGELGREGDPEAFARARRRHRQWYARRWAGAALHDALLADVDEFHDNYLAALRDALAEQDGMSLGMLAVTLGRYWLFTEAIGPGLRWLDGVLASDLLTQTERARIGVLRAGMVLHRSWEPVAAELPALRTNLHGDEEWLVSLEIIDSITHYLAGDLRAAVDSADRAVRVARQHAAAELPEALATRAVMEAANGDPSAVRDAEEAWTAIGPTPSGTHLSVVMPKVALALVDSGHPRRALSVLTPAMSGLHRRLGVEPTGTMLMNAGWAALGADDPGSALRFFVQLLQRRSRPPQGMWLAEACAGAACALAELHDPTAGRSLDAAAELCRRHVLTLSPWQVARCVAARDIAGVAVAADDAVALVDDEMLAAPVLAAGQAITGDSLPG